MTDPHDLCLNCGHTRLLHSDGGCRYAHPHSGSCGSHDGKPPYGAGNTTRCEAFVESAEKAGS